MRIKKIIKNINPKLYYFLQYKKKEIKYIKRKNTKAKEYPNLLEKRYYELTGIQMDINNPQTYSQKIQWLKLYDPNPNRSMLTDKVAVREWIKRKIGSEYLVPIYGVYNSFDEIEFETLPKQFVMKTNHSSGWNIVVKDKNELDIKKAKKQFNKWMKMDYAFWTEFEPHYSNIAPKILIEKYMEDSSGNLIDYKFLCFDDKPEFVWVDFDRFGNHKRNVYDMDWKLQPWTQFTYANYLPEGGVPVPSGFEDMKRIAKILCQGFIHVRVDLYNIDGRIYFGEMTFTNGSGFEQIYPPKYEKIIGDYIKIPIK